MKAILLFCIILLGSKFMYSQTTITLDHNVDLRVPGQWKEVFVDEFNGPTLDLNKWVPRNGVNNCTFPSTIPKSFDLPKNAVISTDGVLQLEVKYDPGVIDTWCNIGTVPIHYEYTSAGISSKQFFGYGKYEADIRVPKGRGFYSSFWLYGEVFHYNEIDIFEMHKFDNYKLIHTNIHYPVQENNSQAFHCLCNSSTSDFWCYDYLTNANYGHCIGEDAIDLSSGLHHWKFIWEPWSMAWFVDNIPIRTIFKYEDQNSNPVTTGILLANTPYSINTAFPEGPMQAIFSVSIDETPGWQPNTSTVLDGNYYLVDYFRYSVHDRGQVNINETNILSTLNAQNLFAPNQFDPAWCVIYGTDIIINTDIAIHKGSYELIASNSITLNQGFSAIAPRASDLSAYNLPEWNFFAHIESGNVSNGRLVNNKPKVDDLFIDSINQNTKSLTENCIENGSSKELTASNTQIESKKISENIEVKIYPNPSSGRFEINFNNVTLTDFKVVIFNSLNIIVYQSANLSNPFPVDLSEFSKGIYYMYLINEKENKVFSNKLILQ